MASLNKCTIIGNLEKDPEVRHTQDGKAIVNLNVACTDTWRDKTSGERKERTEWIRVVIFNDSLAKVAEQYLKKGSQVYLEGQLQTRKWTDKDGVEKYSTEVVLQQYRGELVLLGGKPEAESVGRNDDYQRPLAGAGKATSFIRDGLDDSVPFAAEFR